MPAIVVILRNPVGAGLLAKRPAQLISSWLTHYPNDPGLNGPDRTVDYLFYSPKIKRVEARVRQDDTLRISDHLPVIARFLLPAAP